MNGLLESIKGFFVLGSRDLINKIKIFSYVRKQNSIHRNIQKCCMCLGRDCWELGLVDKESFPMAEKMLQFESLIAEKKRGIKEIEEQIKEYEEQRDKNLEHYDKKLEEQLQQKSPVESEYTDLTIEIKRLKKEIKAAEFEMANLANKLEAQNKRMKELGSKGGMETQRILQEEIRSEIGLSHQFRTLKKENLELLKTNLGVYHNRAEKMKGILGQFDSEINDTRMARRDMLNRYRDQIQQLNATIREIDNQIKSIRGDMTPVLNDLGNALITRRIESEKLSSAYEEADQLEKQKDELQEKINIRRKESASIGVGIKAGFYGFIVAVLISVYFLISLAQ